MTSSAVALDAVRAEPRVRPSAVRITLPWDADQARAAAVFREPGQRSETSCSPRLVRRRVDATSGRTSNAPTCPA
ncbi:hypothetical protein [Actinomadura meridiana]|uniref:hypothetical protein n=1 Tax=Actinomadura meridiana TaxID=559626 RepID=UPI0031EB396D